MNSKPNHVADEIPIAVPYSPGFFGIAKTIYRDLVSIGASPVILAPAGMLDAIERDKFNHIEVPDVRIFSMPAWYDHEVVTRQFKFLLALAEERSWKTIITTPFNMAYLLLRKRIDLNVILIGVPTLLWPSREGQIAKTPPEKRKEYRLSEWRRFYSISAAALGIEQEISLEELYGDYFLLRNIPDMDDENAASQKNVIFGGSMLWDNRLNPGVNPLSKIGSEKGICYFQRGRHFGKSDPWGVLAALFDCTDYNFVIDLQRNDGSTAPEENDRIKIDASPSLHAYEKSLQLIVTSGSPTPVLFALEKGIPLFITSLSSGSHELVEILAPRELCTLCNAANARYEEMVRGIPEAIAAQEKAIDRSSIRSSFEDANKARPAQLAKALRELGYF